MKDFSITIQPDEINSFVDVVDKWLEENDKDAMYMYAMLKTLVRLYDEELKEEDKRIEVTDIETFTPTLQ